MTEEQIRQQFGPALSRLEDDVDLLCQMASVSLPACESAYANAQLSFRAGDLPETAQSLHKLKGMLSTFANDAIVMKVQELLDQTRTEPRPEVLSQTFEQSQSMIEDAIEQIRELATRV